MEIEFYRDKWRIRSVIHTEADIEDMQFQRSDTTVRLVHIIDQEGRPQPNFKTLDVMVDKAKYEEPGDAYYYLKDQTSQVLDYLSFVTYSGFVVQEELGICVDAAKFGDEYKVFVHLAQIGRDIKKIRLVDLQIDKITENEQHIHWLSLMRTAYISITEFEKFFYYYSLLESIAKSKVSETIKEEIKCALCDESYQKDTGRKPTNGYIKQALKEVGASSKQVKYARELRGKYAHGDGKRDSFLKSKTLEVLPFLEEACLVQMAGITNLDIYNCINVKIAGFPLTWAKFKQSNGPRADFIGASSQFPAKFINLSETDIGHNNNVSVRVGVATTENNQMPLISANALPHFIQ